MPQFYVESLDIDVDEFLSSCDEGEIKEIITSLKEDGWITGSNVQDKLGILEKEFSEKLDKLKNSYYRITNEELDILDNLVKKYC
jgi:hypothetical protein